MVGQNTGSTILKATADFMKKCDLPEDEAMVYLTILGIGQTSSGEISLYTGFSLKKTENLLEVLETKGLVVCVGDRIDTYYARPPYEGFAQSLDEFAQTLRTFEKDVSNTSKKSKTAIIKTEKSSKKAITDHIKEFQQATKDMWEQFKTETTDQLEIGLQGITERKNTANKAVEQHITTFGEDSRSAVQSLKSTLSEKAETLVTQLQGILEKTMADSEGNLTRLNETTIENLNSHAKSFETRFSALGQSADMTFKKMKDISDQHRSDFTAALEEMISTEIVRHQNVMETIKKNMGVLSEEKWRNTTKALETAQMGILNPLDEMKESILKLLDIFLKNQESMKEETLERWRQHLVDLMTSIKQELDTTQVEAINIVTGVQSDLTSSLKEKSNNFAKTLTKSVNEIEKKINALIEDVTSKMQQSQKKVSQTTNRAKKDVEAFQTDSAKQFEAFTSTFSEEIGEAQKEMQTSASELMDRHVAGMQVFYDTASSEFSKLIEITTLTTQEQTQDLKRKTGELIETEVSTLTHAMEQIQKGLTKTLGEQKSTLHSDTDKLKKDVSGRLAHVLSVIETIINEIQNDVSTHMTQHTSRFTENADNLLKTLDAMIKERKNAFSTDLARTRSNFETAMDQMIIAYESALTSQVEQITQQFKEEIEKVQGETSEYKQMAGNNLKTTTQTVIQLIRELTSNLLNVLTSSLGNYKENVHITGEELGENISTLMTQIEEETASFRAQFTQTGNMLNEHQTTQINNLSEAIGAECEKFFPQITDATSKFMESSSTALETAISAYEEESAKIHHAFNESIQSQTDALNTMVSTSKTNVETTISQAKEESKSKLDTFIENAAELIDEHITTHDTLISETKNKGTIVTQALNKEVSSLIDKTASELETLVSDEIETNSATIQELKTKITTTVTETIDNTKKQHGEGSNQAVEQKETQIEELTNWNNAFTDKLQTITNSTLETLQQELEDVEQALKEQINIIQDSLGKKTGKTITATEPLGMQLDKRTAQQMTTMRTTADKVLTEIAKTIKTNIEPTKTFADQNKEKLLAIWEETKLMKPRELETTWLVVSLENIKKFLAAMIKRTKSTITMTIPNKLDVPTEVIKKIPTSRRVHIITEIAPDRDDSDKAWVQELYSKPNVRVLKHSKLKYIAAARDGEEVLLAPLQDLPDIAGLASEQEGYVKLYQQIIGPIFMADSREIRRGEVDM